MDAEQVDQELSILISDLSLLYRKYFNHQIRELGLTAVQWQVLSCLARNEGVTQTEIADILNRGKSPVGKTLDSLEAAGWIVREPSKKDRRINTIYLTEKLELVEERLFGVINDMNGVAERKLAPKHIEDVRSGLVQIRQNLLDELER
jgi:DNA-binding MarR family transcriptional regulator